MKYRTLGRVFAVISTFLLLAVVFFFLFFDEKKSVPSGFASDPGLYVHAVSSSDDTEAWQKWQSVHEFHEAVR